MKKSIFVLILLLSNNLFAQVVICTEYNCMGNIKKDSTGIDFGDLLKSKIIFKCYGDIIIAMDKNHSSYKFHKYSLVTIDSNINQLPICKDENNIDCKVELGEFGKDCFTIAIIYEDKIFVYFKGHNTSIELKKEILKRYNDRYVASENRKVDFSY